MADQWAEFKNAAPADPWSEFQPAADASNLAHAGARAPDIGRTAAFGRGAAQGATLGFGDELQGLIQAALPVPGDAGTFAERYRRERDAARAANEAAKQAHPVLYRVGNVAGGAAPTLLAPAAKAAQGASLLTRAGVGALNAAPMGAAFGAGESTAATPGGIATDAALGAAGGAALGAATPVVGGLLKKGAAEAAEGLGGRALRYGRNAIAGVTNALARRKPLAPEAVEAAFQAGAIRPGSTVEGIANRLQEAADPLADRYGQILRDLEAKGVTGPNAAKMAGDLLAEAQQASNNSIIGTRAEALADTGRKLLSKPTAGVAPGGDLGLMQTELMKRELQNAAAGDFVKEGRLSLSGAARKEIAGRFKGAIEDAVAQQAQKAPDEAAAFVPVKEQLHNTLQALGAAREGAGRYARRSPFGLHEAMGLATGIATGNPAEAVGSLGLMHALKERGSSTAAWLARQGAQGARRLAGVEAARAPQSAVLALNPEVSALAEAMRRARVAGPLPAEAEDQQ